MPTAVRRPTAGLVAIITALALLFAGGVAAERAEADLVGFTSWQYYCDWAIPAGNTCGYNHAPHSYSFNSAKHLDGHASSPTVCAGIDTNVAGSGWPGNLAPVYRCAVDFVRVCLAGEVYPNCNDYDSQYAAAFTQNQGVISHQVRGHRGW